MKGWKGRSAVFYGDWSGRAVENSLANVLFALGRLRGLRELVKLFVDFGKMKNYIFLFFLVFVSYRKAQFFAGFLAGSPAVRALWGSALFQRKTSSPVRSDDFAAEDSGSMARTTRGALG